MPQLNSPAPLSRRNFLALSGIAPAALLAATLARQTRAAESSAGVTGATVRPAGEADVKPGPTAPMAAKKIPIGLELYSVRNELTKNLPATLRAVAKMGYEAVEFYAPYYAWTFPFAKDVRALIDDLGLRCYSTHNNIPALTPGETMAKAIELNQILGARHIMLASAPRQVSGLEGWKNLCGQLTTAVDQLKAHGLSAGYHNHQAEWKAIDGGPRIMDVIAQNTPPEFVLQFDVGTAVESGIDPIAWITSNPGRIKSVHLKDWAPGARTEEKAYRVLFREGATPWADIIAAAESVGGVEYYLMEQEGSRYPELETAERCLASWKALRNRA